MKKTLRLLALMLAFLLCAGAMTACHPKNETAVTVGDTDVTSALYLCALIDADMEARETVYNALSQTEGFDASAEIDYASQTIEEKPYEEWVREKALETVKKYAGIRAKFAELGLTLTEDETANAKQYAEYYWNNSGASFLYGENGVSYETYLEYYKTSAMLSNYFLSIYGKDGTAAVAEDEVNAALLENYDIIHAIQSTTTDESGAAKDEEELAADKAKFEGYAERLNNGTATFDEIKKEYSGDTEVEAETDTETAEEGSAPLDKTAVLVGSAETGNYAFRKFDEVHKLEFGKAAVIELDGGVSLLVERLDISKDPYYMKNYYNSTLSILKNDEFETAFKEFYTGLEAKVNDFAVNNFKLDKLDYSMYYSYVNYANQGATAQ